MATFKQVKAGEEIFERCLNAIINIARHELWIDSFVETSRKNKQLASTNGLLSYWKLIKEEKVNWEYEATSKDTAAYYYENYMGLLLHISENPYTGKSKVYHAIGIPESVTSKLNDCTNEELYEKLETIVFNRFIGHDDCELKISDICR